MNKMRSSSTQLTSAFKTLAVTAGGFITIRMLAGAFKEAALAASDLQENTSKFMVVFRGVTEEAMAMRDELVAAYGMSRRESTKTLAAFQDFLVPMGVARDKAAQLSGQFTKLAVDIGSFNNVATADVIEAMKSALSGMAIPMRRFGVDVTETTLKNMAMAKGIKMTGGVLDRTSRAMLIYEKIVKDSADAVGDFARTSNSFANQLKILGASFDDVVTGLGHFLVESETGKGIIGFLNDRLKEMGDHLHEINNQTAEQQFMAMAERALELKQRIEELNKPVTGLRSALKHLMAVEGDGTHGPTKGGWSAMILRWLLFETKLGELLLVCLERCVGLAVVQADWLAAQPSGEPRARSEAQ